MARRAVTAGPGRGLGLSAVGLVVAGLLVSVLLAVVARSVTVPQYALFSLFWSLALIAGFGVFLPVEQWLAQAGQTSPQHAARSLRSASRLVLVLIAVEAVVAAVVGGVLLVSLDGGPGIVAALLTLVAVSGAQFLVRGHLIAQGRLGAFTSLLVLDVLLRLGLALLLGARATTTASAFAWAVVAGIGLAHVPVLVVLLRRTAGPVAGGSGRPSSPVRPVLVLLVGSLGAQVLFNAPAVAVSAVAQPGDLAQVGVFQAAFQLVRVPLFLAVPLQATLIPLMSAALRRWPPPRTRLVMQLVVGAGALVTLGIAVGLTAGPWMVRLLFGARYDASPTLVATLGAGAAAYLALLVLTQLFVADGRHLVVGTSWLVGVGVAVAVFATQDDPISAGSWSFTLGCVAGLLCALAALGLAAAGPTQLDPPPVCTGPAPVSSTGQVPRGR